MIEWSTPERLWGLAALPAVVVFLGWALRRRRQALARFADTRLLAAVAPDLDWRRQVWRASLLVIAFGLLVLALAGPQWGFQWEEARREGVDILVALDTSHSMLAEDIKPNRLERAKLAVQDLTQRLRGDRIGLVAFAGTAFVQCPLTLDYDAFAQSVQAVSVDIIPKGGTALAEAISTGVQALEGSQGRHAALVLITDGEDHEGKIDEAVKRAIDRGIKMYTVGIGTADGELIPVPQRGERTYLKDRRGNVVKSRLDDETLKRIATESGGAYVHATGPNLGLDVVYTDYLSTMEKRELHSTMVRRFEERFQVPLGIALVLLVVEPLLGSRRRVHTVVRRRWPWRKRTV